MLTENQEAGNRHESSNEPMSVIENSAALLPILMIISPVMSFLPRVGAFPNFT
jgi:hypothetical protein